MSLAPSTPVRPLMPSSPLVLVSPGEDRASHERHLLCLKRECKNIRPNKQVPTTHANPACSAGVRSLTLGSFYLLYPQVTKELMKRTFTFRRQDILDGAFTMETLFSTYPPLKHPDEVCCCIYL